MQKRSGPARCSLRGCKGDPRWRPFVYVPIARLTPEHAPGTSLAPRPVHELMQRVLVVPLPMVVCDAHKLPHRIEHQLIRSRRFRRLLAERLASRGSDWIVRMERAWVAHERIADDRGAS